jgi:AAHS family benzoate transporter-like MFS transporter
MRSTLVTLMFSGYSVGGMLAAVLGKGLIETYGWSYVFYAAAVPVLLIPFVLMSLPESMAFLLKKGRIDELKKIVQRLEPSYTPPPATASSCPAPRRSKAPRSASCSRTAAVSAPPCSGSPSSCACSWCMRSAPG